MEKLKYHTAYTCGPIDDVSSEDATNWRKDISQFLQSLDIFCISPTDKPIKKHIEDKNFVDKMTQLKKEKRYDELHELGKPIRQFDLRCVDISNFVIAYLDFDVKMCGTYNEIFQTDLQRKMCLIMSKQGLEAIPNWLWFTFPKECFYSSWSDLKKYITEVNNGIIKNPHKRWWLIDYQKILPSQLIPAQQSNPPPETTTHEDMSYCEICDTQTQQIFHIFLNPTRHNWQTCLECGSTYHASTQQWMDNSTTSH